MSDTTFDLTGTNPSDPTGSIVTATKPATVLARLKEALEKKVTRPDVELEVPERPGVRLVINPNIDYKEELEKWGKVAGNNNKGREPDAQKYACLIIAHKTVGVVFEEEEAMGANGSPLGFASPEILEYLNPDGIEPFRPTYEAVRAMFGNDHHVQAAAEKILAEAGYGDTVEVANPLTDS